jgi:uncharacterized membrane protein (UPF0127 family)
VNARVPGPLERLGDRLDNPTGWDRVRRAAWVVLAAAFLSLLVRGGASPADPYVSATARVPMSGFGQIALRVTDAAGASADWCALLAENAQQRGKGLMGQSGLNGYDAMAFVYQQPSTSGFWMKGTIIPLAVAYFDGAGHFVSAQGMDPCPADATDCPTYPPAAPYVTAVEVPRGGLGRLGIGPGSAISFPGGPCPS